jgi:hypothetical protein
VVIWLAMLVLVFVDKSFAEAVWLMDFFKAVKLGVH